MQFATASQLISATSTTKTNQFINSPLPVIKMFLRLVLLLALLQLGVSLAVPLFRSTSPQALSIAKLVTLLEADNRDDILAQLKNIHKDEVLYDNFENPADSCSDLPKGYKSGYYFIRNSTSLVNVEFCDMDKTFGTDSVGWMRVVNLDMTNSNEKCPVGLKEEQNRCTKVGTLQGCSSVTFSTHGHQYSSVCGKIEALQYSHPSAFRPYIQRKPVTTLEDNYVDGVSLTHGPVSQRQHIWTFAAAYSNDSMQCECGTLPDPDLVPPFVGRDFFCDTASRDQNEEEIVYENDPLWDGQNCDYKKNCCSFNNPPWFCKQLPQSTTDDIEMRLCLNEDPIYGEVLIENVELYVQ